MSYLKTRLIWLMFLWPLIIMWKELQRPWLSGGWQALFWANVHGRIRQQQTPGKEHDSMSNDKKGSKWQVSNQSPWIRWYLSDAYIGTDGDTCPCNVTSITYLLYAFLWSLESSLAAEILKYSGIWLLSSSSTLTVWFDGSVTIFFSPLSIEWETMRKQLASVLCTCNSCVPAEYGDIAVDSPKISHP